MKTNEDAINYYKKLERESILKFQEKAKQFNDNRFSSKQETIKNEIEHNINVSELIFDLLEELGFDRNQKGTIYLNYVILSFYRERKAFDNTNNFFDFNQKNNSYYFVAKDYFRCSIYVLLKEIKSEIIKSYVTDSSMNEIIYWIINDLIVQLNLSEARLNLKSK